MSGFSEHALANASSGRSMTLQRPLPLIVYFAQNGESRATLDDRGNRAVV